MNIRNEPRKTFSLWKGTTLVKIFPLSCNIHPEKAEIKTLVWSLHVFPPQGAHKFHSADQLFLPTAPN